jgi:hypothetical protein
MRLSRDGTTWYGSFMPCILSLFLRRRRFAGTSSSRGLTLCASKAHLCRTDAVPGWPLQLSIMKSTSWVVPNFS